MRGWEEAEEKKVEWQNRMKKEQRRSRKWFGKTNEWNKLYSRNEVP